MWIIVCLFILVLLRVSFSGVPSFHNTWQSLHIKTLITIDLMRFTGFWKVGLSIDKVLAVFVELFAVVSSPVSNLSNEFHAGCLFPLHLFEGPSVLYLAFQFLYRLSIPSHSHSHSEGGEFSVCAPSAVACSLRIFLISLEFSQFHLFLSADWKTPGLYVKIIACVMKFELFPCKIETFFLQDWLVSISCWIFFLENLPVNYGSFGQVTI